LPQRFFANDLLQACTPTAYILAEQGFELRGFARRNRLVRRLFWRDSFRRCRARSPCRLNLTLYGDT